MAASIVAAATTPSRTTVLLALVLAVPDLAQRHDPWPELMAAALAFMLWASIIWSESPALSERVFMDQAIVAAMFMAFRIALTNRRAVLLIGSGYLVGCVFLLRDLLTQNAAATLSLRVSTSTRYSLEGVNQNYIAFTFAGGITVALLLAYATPKWWWLFVGAGVLCWTGIALNDTRAAIIAAALTTAWAIGTRLFRRFARTALRVLVGAVLAVAFAIFTGLADHQLQSAFAGSSARETGSLNGRLDFWPIAREVFSDHPWLGIGAGSVTRYLPGGIFSHNVFLDVGTSAGLVGVAVFLGAMYVTLFRATRDLASPRRDVLLGLAVCAIAAPLLSGYWYQTAPFWMLLALFSRIGVLEPRSDGDEALAAVPALAGREPVAGRASATATGPVAAIAASPGRSRR